MDARKANDRIADKAELLRFVSRVPMLCECSDPACQSIFLIELDRYQELRENGYLTSPGHTLDGCEQTAREDGYWVQRPTRR